MNPDMFSGEFAKIFHRPGLFFIHKRSIEKDDQEVMKVLQKYGYSVEDARKSISEFIANTKIQVIRKDYENNEILQELRKKCAEKGIEFHSPDCFIIADFKKNGLNTVYSNNNHFNDACRLVGMCTIKFPTLERALERKIQQIFSKRR